MSQAFELLGLRTGADARDVKRAYARLLKQTHPEDDAEAFQQLRAAYERALQELRWAQEEREWEAEQDEGAASQQAQNADERVVEKVANPPDAPAPAHKATLAPQALQAAAQEAPQALVEPRYASPEALVAELEACLELDGEAAACTRLSALLRGDVLLSFDAREAFQAEALQTFAANPRLRPQLLHQLVETFGWHDHQHPLQAWPQMETALYAHNVIRARESLRKVAEGKLTDSGSARRIAAKLILNPKPGLLYWLEVLNIRSSDITALLIAQLQERYGPAWMEGLSQTQRELWLGRRSVMNLPSISAVEIPWSQALASLVGILLAYLLGRALLWTAGMGTHSLTPAASLAGLLYCLGAGIYLAKRFLFRAFSGWGAWAAQRHQSLIDSQQQPSGRARVYWVLMGSQLAVGLPRLLPPPLAEWFDTVLTPPALVLFCMGWAVRLGHLGWALALPPLGGWYWIATLPAMENFGVTQTLGNGLVFALATSVACYIMLFCQLLGMTSRLVNAYFCAVGLGFGLLLACASAFPPP